MAFVTCPSCGEKGRLPKELVGKRIKCQKCGTAFLVAAPTPKVPAAALTPEAAAAAHAAGAHAGHHGETIEVDGLDDSAWTATPEGDSAHGAEHAHDESPAAFTASPQEPHHAAGGAKEYKLLTQKDKYFEGKFEFSKLEDALNHYARQGWVVRTMATPQIAGFSGGPREEVVVLLER